MRLKLVESMERITRHAQELETRVHERTRQINESQKRAELLLQKVISTQEDERKRIGRELHDDTLQELSAVLMRIDMCRIHPAEDVTLGDIDKIRQIIVQTLDGVIGIIQNLRPTLLDDLGLVAAIKSLLDMHLGENGINYFINTDRRHRPAVPSRSGDHPLPDRAGGGREYRPPCQGGERLRADQDRRRCVHVDIEDDGEGFDLNSLFVPARATTRRTGGGSASWA